MLYVSSIFQVKERPGFAHRWACGLCGENDFIFVFLFADRETTDTFSGVA